MPRMKFSDIYTRVESISNVSNQRALIKDGIQMALDRATAVNLPYLMTESFITTVAPYETGTVAMTNGSATITGTTTVWTAAMVGRKIRFNNENAYYRISAVGSSTSITLEVPYQGTTDTDATYSIYKDEYRLPADCDVYKVLRQIENSESLISLETNAFDILEPTPESQGSPNYEILIGTKLDTYTTGTISGMVNATTLTGAGTSWASVEGLGKGSRITIGSNVYTVKSVDSNTQLTIYEPIVTTIAALTTYTIHLNNLIVQLFKIPDAVENIYFRYQRIPYPLVNDVDIPDLPEKYHWVLVQGGLIWAWATKDKEESVKQQGVFELAIQQMWARIGYPSTSRSYPRLSQDEIAMRRNWTGPKLPTGYGVPFSL